jgi:predicted amidohydrolase
MALCAGAASAAAVARFSEFAPSGGAAEGWKTWTPRAEISPRFSVDGATGRSGGGSLALEAGGSPAAVGAWRREVPVQAGKTYRINAYYRTQGTPFEERSVWARLDWLGEGGKRLRAPDYALAQVPDDKSAWRKVEHFAAAPEGARTVFIELGLAWAPRGSVRWDDISLEETSTPPNRVVRGLVVGHRPRNTKSAAESLEQFCRLVEGAAAQKPDLVCLPEGATVIGTGKSYAEVAESIPGPSTARLGELSKKLGCYLVAGIYEREGSVIYNTAVLLDRNGKLAGKYRKTHLPREEVEAGLTPGDSYPVFDTDFGKVGLMICWDLQFPEPARAMALKGAEVILLPIWGGSEILAKARAIENHVFLLTSSYDMKTFIVDPAGAVLAETTTEKPVAVAELHLDRKILQPWLGDMKPRTWKERRPDIPVAVLPTAVNRSRR